MVSKFFTFSLVFFMLIALGLFFAGVSNYVVLHTTILGGTSMETSVDWYSISPIDNGFWNIFNSLNENISFKIVIPDIPMIPHLDVGVLDFLFDFINGFTTFINILIGLSNTILDMLRTIVLIVVAFVQYVSGMTGAYY